MPPPTLRLPLLFDAMPPLIFEVFDDADRRRLFRCLRCRRARYSMLLLLYDAADAGARAMRDMMPFSRVDAFYFRYIIDDYAFLMLPAVEALITPR